MLFEFAVPVRHTSPSSKAISSNEKPEASSYIRTLAAKEVLFRVGDVRTSFYRVEKGAICLYEPRWNDERSIIDFAFPGDYVGLGFLETQSCCASAICDCQVTCLPWDQLDEAIKDNPGAQRKLQDAIEREFELRRSRIIARGEQFPLERVAAFLSALSSTNASEGRDPNVIGDALECGFVADSLGLSIEALGGLLVELKNRGVIGDGNGKNIRVLDIEALEALANGNGDWARKECNRVNRTGRPLAKQASAAGQMFAA